MPYLNDGFCHWVPNPHLAIVVLMISSFRSNKFSSSSSSSSSPRLGLHLHSIVHSVISISRYLGIFFIICIRSIELIIFLEFFQKNSNEILLKKSICFYFRTNFSRENVRTKKPKRCHCFSILLVLHNRKEKVCVV